MLLTATKSSVKTVALVEPLPCLCRAEARQQRLVCNPCQNGLAHLWGCPAAAMCGVFDPELDNPG